MLVAAMTMMPPRGSLFLLLLLSCFVVHRLQGCHAGAAGPTEPPTKSPTKRPTREPTKAPTRRPGDACTLDSTPPDVTCPNATVTLRQLGDSIVKLQNFAAQAALTAEDACGVQSLTQVPAAGTALSVHTTTLVNVTATDYGGNAQTCTIQVDVHPSSLLYQTTYAIQGRRVEAQQTSFVVPTAAGSSGEGLIHAITGTLNTSLYYYAEVVRAVLLKQGANETEPGVAVSPRILIQWRRKEATHAYDDESLYVSFANDTVFTLAMSSNYIEAPYTVTYRVYGQLTS